MPPTFEFLSHLMLHSCAKDFSFPINTVVIYDHIFDVSFSFLTHCKQTPPPANFSAHTAIYFYLRWIPNIFAIIKAQAKEQYFEQTVTFEPVDI